MSAALVETIDHLVYAVPNVDAACAELEHRLGVRASPGGQHLGRGTRNALVAIGPRCYLEIVGPDPAQPAPPRARWFGIDDLSAPRLVTWAASTGDLDRVAQEASRRGVRLGEIIAGGRERPDGVALRWRVTDPTTVIADGIVPFFIDWGTSPHPAESAAIGPRLIGLRTEHPSPRAARAMLDALEVALEVERADRPALIATFQTPAGEIELR